MQAYGAKVDRGFTTHTQVCKSLNVDREDVVTLREAEVKDAIERAKRIEQLTGEDVPWQIFCGLESPKAKSATKGEGELETESKKDKGKEEE